MPVEDTKPAPRIRVIQRARSEAQIIRHVQPEARTDEVVASTCSCVVHLCGCK